jgi:nitrate/nitrite-specific signal transduction histidine kinase
MELLLILVILVAVVALVGAPIYAKHAPERRQATQVAELEAAKEAKYAEIRELELDFRTGKLSEPDFKTLDRQLRNEAIQILRKLDAAKGEAPSGD